MNMYDTVQNVGSMHLVFWLSFNAFHLCKFEVTMPFLEDFVTVLQNLLGRAHAVTSNLQIRFS